MDREKLPLKASDRYAIGRIFAPLVAEMDARLVLFGSRARGDARPRSDIDLAVRSEQPIAAATLAQLRDALEESQVPFRIDLVDYARASVQLREAIDREGIAWPA